MDVDLLMRHTIVVVASVVPATAAHSTLVAIVAAAVCFPVRLTGLHFERDGPAPARRDRWRSPATRPGRPMPDRRAGR